MSFDEWLDNQLGFWEGLTFGTQSTQQAKLLKLVRVQRQLLAGADYHGQPQTWLKLENEVTALEAALMGIEQCEE